ncbi:CPBP family intramembrane glutamic endopeptidase [Gracilimonas mengyeensis]|uniref:CAAX prenyl protease 2/Lysostaphin resistance protein A-like domain-containing protein n=1 Tax=Gracilimonas mengyeensis TaxID=1302730 RepID=A0A521CP85_9BACT|nr:type II CAAX endopeptidase family protein [Gracilimonas mengyeensis]SMO61269.1 hypothetical protein SAMN06265219_10643 [Gracilimonas mengyeensis]
MINPIYNGKEQRLRALFRILLFIFAFIASMGVSTLIPFVWLSYLVRSLLILGLFYVMFRFGDRRPWHYAGLSINRRWINECLAGVLIAGGVMGLIFITEWLTGGLEINRFAWQRGSESLWLIPIIVFFVQMASVGFYEEVLSRGYWLPNMTEGFTLGSISPQKASIIAIVLSSAIFGVAHGSNPNASMTAVVNIMLAGVMLAIPFIITGRLALSIGIHFSWNFFQGGIFGFRVSGMEVNGSLIEIRQLGPEWWTGGSFGPEAGLIGIFGILLILGITLLYLKMTDVPLTYAELFSKPFEELKDHENTEIV